MRAERSVGQKQEASAFRTEVGAGLIVDLGCGPGRLREALGHPVISLDASLAMLCLVEARPHGRLVLGDLEALPVADSVARGVSGNLSYQRLPRPNFATALAEAVRALEPGGLIQLAMHAGDFEGDDRADNDLPGRWFTFWRRDPLMAQLANAGFDLIRYAEGPDTLRVTARLTRRR